MKPFTKLDFFKNVASAPRDSDGLVMLAQHHANMVNARFGRLVEMLHEVVDLLELDGSQIAAARLRAELKEWQCA
jgi:S-adenosylmethionine:tRNA-ribosyltransferase-isomerase (queuine synthetase)